MTISPKQYLSEVKPYVPGKSPEDLKRELGVENIIKMASNESAVSPPPAVLEAVKAASEGLRTYPDSRCLKLRAKLAEKYGICEDQFVFGNGSDDIIVMAARVFLDPFSEVILPSPSFLYYRIVAGAMGAEIKRVSLESDFSLDVDKLLDAITEKTRLIFLSNPNNPTGSMVEQKQLERLIGGLDEKTVLFLDEAYFEYVDREKRPSLYEHLRREDRTVIISRTFSKAYALAGLRIGYGIMGPAVRELLEKVRAPFNVNSVAQAAACAALECEEYFEEHIAETKKEVRKLCLSLEKLGMDYVRSNTNFVLIDTKRPSPEVSNHLLLRGIIVRDMAMWGLDGFLRVNLSTPEDNERFIGALEKAIKDIPEKVTGK